MIVSVNNKSNWPEAKFLRTPTTEKVLEFLHNHLAPFGVPRQNPTDAGSSVCSERLGHFCRDLFFEDIESLVRDHREIGKNERCFRTITERLRGNKRIVLEKDNTGLSGIFFSSPTARGHNAQSPAEVQMGRQHNICGDLLKSSSTSISEDDRKFQLELNEFPHDADSAILVREGARGSKLEPAFRHQGGRKLSESKHTLSLLPAGKATPRLLSKRSVAHARQQSDKQKPPLVKRTGAAK